MLELICIVVFVLFWLAGSYLNWTVTKDSAAKFRTTYPLGSESPTVLDSHGQNTRKGFQERLDIDHVFAVDGDGGMDGADTGKHKQITFVDPISTPTAGASEGILYSKDVSDKAELHYVDEDTNEIQISSAGNLLLTAAAVEAAKANILDETTVYSKSGVITLKDGGIKKAHFDNSDAKDCVDDDTIEIDGTNGLQLKNPTTPSGGDINLDVSGAPVSGWKRYAGNAGAQDIDCGFVIRHFVIRQATGTDVDSKLGIEGVVDDTGLTSWQQTGSGTTDTGVTLGDSQTLTLEAGKDRINQSGKTYTIFADGVRL